MNFLNLKLLTVFLVSGFLATGSAQAYTVYPGADASGSTINSEAAFADWQSAVSAFSVDDMSGISCDGGAPEECTTSDGNTFTQGVGDLMAGTFTGGVASGPVLVLVQTGSPGSFTWDFAQPANAFGFFVHDTDGDTVTINFDDGSAQEFMIASGEGTEDNLFWGIAGLEANITSVTITADDIPGWSQWDRFALGTTVPVPAALPLFLSGLAFFGFVARRRGRAKAA